MSGSRASRRLHLHEHARSTWDDEAATELMISLPSNADRLVSKEDLTTAIALVRKDLEVVEARLHGRIEAVVGQGVRATVFAVVAANATMIGGAVGLAQLFG